MTQRKYQSHREPLTVRFGMGIPRGLTKGFGYLSSIPGYKGVIAPLLALGALSVGVETTYKIMPNSSWSLPKEERAFIPKLAVEDGAEIGRVIPFKTAASSVVRYVMPDSVDRLVPRSKQAIVWTDPSFWFAVVLCSAIQYQESKLFRRKDYSDVKSEALKANQKQRIDVNPKALDVAKIKVAKHNAYGLGSETRDGFMIILLYGAEVLGFCLGFKGATGLAASLGWGLYTVFGFETFFDRDDEGDNLKQAYYSSKKTQAAPKDSSGSKKGRHNPQGQQSWGPASRG